MAALRQCGGPAHHFDVAAKSRFPDWRHSLLLTYRGRAGKRCLPVAKTVAAPSTATVISAPPAQDEAGVDPVKAASAAAPAPVHSSVLWTRNWVPVSPVACLDPSRPTPITLLGQPLVLWQHATRGWVVMRDACPHRLAPLSEGRLEAGATRLACAYHGWEFDERGTCARVPQLAADPKAAATACSSGRSCVASFPTMVHDGVLFTWLDDSKEGLAAIETAPKPVLLDERATPLGDWFMSEMPCDYKFWLEQGMDPSHANFLHHGVGGFRQANYLPMEGKVVQGLDLLKGYRWEHGAYEQKQKGMKAEREFLPPFTNRFSYPVPNGGSTYFCTMVVPLRPGVCRTFFKFGMGQKGQPQQQEAAPKAAAAAPSNGAGSANGAAAAAPAQTGGDLNPNAKNVGRSSGIFALMGRLPHWVLNSQLIGDQDVVMMCRQELLMRRQGLTYRDYNLNSMSDAGVASANRWMSLTGYPTSLWGEGPVTYTGQTFPNWPSQELPLEQILSRQERHVKHCVVCQRGMQLVTKICTALTVAAALVVAGAAALAMIALVSPNGMAAVGGWGPLVGVAAAAVALVVAAVKGWDYREERFLTGAKQWRRIGGFTLLGMKIKD